MAESQVQLKREEIVGDEVVLSDINPQTTTESVTDITNGMQLDDTLTRILNAINNKISRYVCSVNGRTGVVVLTAKDVGLGNVDNMSFADVQNWVIDQIKEEFGSRAFKLYNNMDAAKAAEDTNDKSLSGAGFYASAGLTAENDHLGYIGVFLWDDENETLNMISRPVNIIGSTDNSILYNETSHGQDYTGGKLGINIWKDEDGLEVYNGTSADPLTDPKENSGLRLVRENIVPHFETMLGCYGSDFEHPGSTDDSWLYANTHPDNAPTVKIIYDGKDLTTNEVFYAKRVFKLKDQFICCFSAKYGYNYDDQCENLNLPAGVSPALVDQHNALGIVTEVTKNDQDVVTSYTVEFTPLAPRVGDGIAYANYFKKYSYRGDAHEYEDTMHNNQLSINTANGAVTTEVVHDDILDPASTYIPDHYIALIHDNVSGLTIRRNRDQRHTNGESYAPGVTSYAFTNLPAGPFPTNDPRYRTYLTKIDGVAITPDASLCVIPYSSYQAARQHVFDPDPDHPDSDRNKQYNSFIDFYESGNVNNLRGSDCSSNWRSDADFYDNDNSSAANGFSMLGINLNKAMMRLNVAPDATTLPALANISGLKIFQYSKTVDGRIFGGETADDIPENYQMSEMTGGLAINCGKYLHIEPSGYHGDSDKFYDGGKLTIDTGFGFEDDDGKMAISIEAGKGLQKYTDDQGQERLGVKTHRGGLGFEYGGLAHGALTLLNNYITHTTGIAMKAVYLTPAEVTSFDRTDNEYENNMGGPNARVFSINADQGLLVDVDNYLRVKTETYKIEYDETGKPKRNADGTIKRTVHGHGLQFYGDEGNFGNQPGIDDQDWDPRKVLYGNDGLGVQVNDPDTGTNHGLFINDKGTLCVQETVDVVKKWKIEGTEVTTINGIEADRQEKSYEYIPNKDALTIKLGKGLIFIDERASGYDPDDPDGCPCGCDCINYDNGSGKSGASFEIYDYIMSDGRQKIDSIGVTFNLNTKHIALVSFIPDFNNMNTSSVIFEVGKHGASGAQAIMYEKSNPGATVTLYGAGTSTIVSQNTTDGALMKDKRYDLIASIDPALIYVDWADTTLASQLVEPTASGAVDPPVILSDKLMSLFGPSGAENESLNAKIKLFGLKLYEVDSDVMIADLVPCKSSAGYFGLFDRVNKRFYRNNSTDLDEDFTGGTPTGEIINGKGEPITPPDPETLVTYDELTYIASDGHQSMITSVEFASMNSPHIIIPEIKTASSAAQTFYTIGTAESTGCQYGGFNGTAKVFGIDDETITVPENKIKLVQDSTDAAVANSMIFDGYAQYETGKLFVKWIEDNTEAHLTNQSSGKDDFTVSSGTIARTPITLFCMSASIYMYRFKIAENNPTNIIADFVPVISSNNEIGLLDRVNKKFIRKTEASQAFTAGSRTGTRFDYQGNEI